MGFLGASVIKWRESAPAPPAAESAIPSVIPRETPNIPIHSDRSQSALISLPEPPAPDISRPIAVSVCGAVNRADVYRFEKDRRVQHAIDAAGGLMAEADIEDINIAAKLMDNTTLYIPFKVFTRQEGHRLVARRSATAAEMNPGRYTRSGWAQKAPESAAPIPNPLHKVVPAPSPQMLAAPSKGLINLNQASLQELQELPGIGPKTAEKIIAYRQERPFERIEDLMEVHGIGDKKMEAVRNLVTVE